MILFGSKFIIHILSIFMGNQQPQPKPQPKVNLEDALIDMKIQSKQVIRAAKNSEKQSAQYMKRAKQALKKNNEQGAKMYLMSASQKKNEALNFQRTAVKMDIMCDRIKSMKSNENMVAMFGKMSHAINQQMNSLDAVQMATSMQTLNQQMDNMMINNKMMGQIMEQPSLTEDNTANQMLNVLKQQIALEDSNNLNIYVPQQQLNINQNVNQKNQNTLNVGNSTNTYQQGGQPHDPFLDELKDL